MSDSFQVLRPSSMRASSRLVCSSGLTSSQYFRRIIPESTTTLSNEAKRFLEMAPSSARRHLERGGYSLPAGMNAAQTAEPRQFNRYPAVIGDTPHSPKRALRCGPRGDTLPQLTPHRP